MTTAREARQTIAGQLRTAANGALIGVQIDTALAHTIADLLDSCLSCEAPAGRPHTDYCRRPNRDYPGQPGERRRITTFGPGGDNVPVDLPSMPLPPMPPAEDD